jgi:hypothetical protein
MGYPIADIKLTEYQFCPYFSQTNISPNKQGTYTLELQTITEPCSQTDPRMITVDTLNEYDFYTNNTSKAFYIFRSILNDFKITSLSKSFC